MIRITALVAKKGNNVIGFAYINDRRYLKTDKKDFGLMVKEEFQGREIGDRLTTEIPKG